MANLKEIRNRIASVKSTRQITSAMKMVSAAKFKKAQDAITRLRPYASKLYEIYKFVSSSLESTDVANIYTIERKVNRVLIVVITSNKGLCGSFNQNVLKKAINMAHDNYGKYLEEDNLDFFTIGKKATDFLRKKGYRVARFDNDLLENLTFDNALPLIDSVLEDFLQCKYDRIELVYNQFKNAASQVLTAEQYLPVVFDDDENEEETRHDYIFEPSKEYIIEELVFKSLKIQFYRALLDSHAAEHGARMTAMHKATDNATTMIGELQLTYNKARQAAITNEILEIVSGAEALGK